MARVALMKSFAALVVADFAGQPVRRYRGADAGAIASSLQQAELRRSRYRLCPGASRPGNSAPAFATVASNHCAAALPVALRIRFTLERFSNPGRCQMNFLPVRNVSPYFLSRSISDRM